MRGQFAGVARKLWSSWGVMLGTRDRVVSVRAVATPAHATKLRERGILASWFAAREGRVVTAAIEQLSSVFQMMPWRACYCVGSVSAAQVLATKGCSRDLRAKLEFSSLNKLAAVRTRGTVTASKDAHRTRVNRKPPAKAPPRKTAPDISKNNTGILGTSSCTRRAPARASIRA